MLNKPVVIMQSRVKAKEGSGPGVEVSPYNQITDMLIVAIVMIFDTLSHTYTQVI